MVCIDIKLKVVLRQSIVEMFYKSLLMGNALIRILPLLSGETGSVTNSRADARSSWIAGKIAAFLYAYNPE